MELKLVESTNIHSIGYDEETQTLRIRFHNTGVYDYAKVSASIYTQLMTAESVGSTFHKLVKTGGFSYEKVLTTAV